MKYTRREGRPRTDVIQSQSMSAFLLVIAFLAVGPACISEAVGKKDEPPHALISFFDDPFLERWTSVFTMTTASRARYEVQFEYGVKGNIYDSDTLQLLLAANWVVKGTGNEAVRVYGVRTKSGETDTIKSLVLTNRRIEGKGRMPRLRPVGDVAVEVKTVRGKRLRIIGNNLLSPGPQIENEPFVEFDLSTFPSGVKDVLWELKWEVGTGAGSPLYGCAFEVDSIHAAEQAGLYFLDLLASNGFKAELIGMARIRVYGGVFNGRFFPAMRGTVTSPHLKPEDLPKVNNARS